MHVYNRQLDGETQFQLSVIEAQSVIVAPLVTRYPVTESQFSQFWLPDALGHRMQHPVTKGICLLYAAIR